MARIEQGQDEQKAYDYNASIIAQNTNNQVVAEQEKTTARIGAQATSYAASGVDITSGSPLLIMAATAARGAQQSAQIEEAGTSEANLQRYYGSVAAFGGTMAGIGSFLSGVAGQSTAYAKATNNPSPSAGPNYPHPSWSGGGVIFD